MNTDIRLVLVGGGNDARVRLERAVQAFVTHERTLSRFDQVSELSALNRTGGEWTRVSPLLYQALSAADALRTRTGGLYDPSILPALEAAGYDRSFEQLAAAETTPMPEPPAPRSRADHPSRPPYELEPSTRRVRLAPGVRLDLGGIGKGLAVDAAAACLRAGPGFLVDAGGDIRVGGESPDGGPWGIAVQDPGDLDSDLAVLALTDCAVATSSTGRRRWLRDGAMRHHLIDPRTGTSATGDALAATVVAPECATAEVWAKAAVIAGVEEGLHLAARERLACLIVDRGRRLHVNEAMRPFLATAAA